MRIEFSNYKFSVLMR